MNVSSRKTTNQSYKRESFPYPHQPSSANAQDGMSLSATNTLPLTTGGTASVPSAANSISQHTASYLPGSSLPAPGAHIQTAASYHLQHGSASSSQPTLLTSHTQGPPPSSTPPTVPNETKGPGQYQNYSHNMNQHHFRIQPQPYQTAPILANNNSARNHNQTRLPQVQRYLGVNSLNPAHPMAASPYPSIIMPNVLSASNAAATALQPQNYSIPGTGTGEHSLVYMPATYTYYNSVTAARTNPWSATTRTTAQNIVPVGPNNTMLPSSQSAFLSMNPVASMSQQQVQQQHAPAVSSLKPRTKNVIAITHPETGECINAAYLDENKDNNTAKPDKKNLSSDVKRVSESSSSSSSSTTFSSPTSSATFVSKEPNQSVPNGTTPNVPYVSSTNNYKPPSQSGAANTFGQVDDTTSSVVGSIKPPTFAPPSTQPVIKKAAKEETLPCDAQSEDSKVRDKQSAPPPSWPETPASVPPTIVASAQVGSRGPPAGAKKSPKDAEPVSAVSGSSTPALTAPTIPAAPGDTVNKTSIVTMPAAAGLEEFDVGAKKVKQGIQSGVGGPKDGIPSVKLAAGKPSVAANQSLPETTAIPASISGPPSSAQNNAAKADSKPQTGVPQHPVAQVAQLSSGGVSAIAGVKPPASAIPTIGPVSEKSASATTAPASSESASKSSGGSNTVASSAEKTPKDDKTSPPPTKSKNRGNQPNDSNANDHSSSSKGKTAQSVPKHHGADVAKTSGSTSPPNAVSTKTNGETVEQNASSEGKTKKKKSSTKKELNKKGQEKEGSDMDIFTKIEHPTTLSEKSVRAEKVPQSNSQPLTNNVNANNRSKISSSQKTENVSSVNSLESKEKSISSQNIPNASSVLAHNKTENDTPVDETESEPKRYSVEYLLSLRDLPQCRVSVNVAYHAVMSSQGGSGPRGMSQNGFAAPGNSFLPLFMTPGNSTSLAPRKSQQGSMRRENKPNQIHVSYSLREEIPLRISENAWRPKILGDKKDEESKTDALYKTARGLLNKLTPEKFPVIMDKFQKLNIDSEDRLKGVIELIFEKAVDEPGFCKWYAEMCSVMQDVNVDKDSKKSFRALLLNKCQSHFESTKTEEMEADQTRAEMEALTDPEKKKELQLLIEEKERKTRRKNVGNCRFIGELFKFKMLTPRIMLNCTRVLINTIEEESLECLCKLLSTIGKDLDEKLPKDVDQFFKRLQDIADPKKKEKISSRIRFMILDVIDLRKNRWVPRRETDNPKTIDQMNMEMEKKEQEQRLASMTMRKSYDDYSRNSRDSRKNRNDNQPDGEHWKTVTNRSSMAKINYKYDAQKIASITNVKQQEGPSLGRPQVADSWRHGAGGAKKPAAYTQMETSRSAALSGLKSASGGKLTPSSSLERPKPNLPIRDDDTNKMSRSGSAQSVHPASREGSVQRTVPSRNASQTAPVPTPAPSANVPLSETQIERFSNTLFKEFIANQSVRETVEDFKERFKAKEDQEKAIVKFIEQTLEKPAHIADCGKIVTALLKADAVSVPTVVNAASTLLELADDLKYDYPKFWEYMVNLFIEWPLLDKDCHLYNELKTVIQRLPNQKECQYALQEIEKAIRNDKDHIFEFLSRALHTEEYDNVFKWVNENVDNPNNNTKLVEALTEAVCEVVLEKKLKVDEISDRFGRYFKKYIDNKETLELTCLNVIVDFSRRKEHPQGLALDMFEGLYDAKALSSDSYMQLKKNGQGEELGVVLMNVKNFYDYLENPEADD